MENSSPLVSIIIPTFNRVGMIKETLESLENQTYRNWQAIVVDDGSSDGTFEMVKNISPSEKRIQLFKRHREPKGAPTCRNIGIEQSQGEYLIFLDSDDLLADFCLERRVNFFKEYPDEDFLVFQSLLFEEKKDDKNLLWNIDSEEDDLQRFLRIDALWATCGPIYKKKVVENIGGFREGLPFYQDFDLHLRCLLLKLRYRKFLNLEPDCFKRHHFNNSVSNSIPFTSDPEILQQRINFYLYQLEFVKQRDIQLTKQQVDAAWGILFFFCNRYVAEHDNFRMFYINWRKAGKLLPVNNLNHLLTLIVPLLTSLQKQSKYFIKLKSLYLSAFKKYIADEQMILNSSLYKISAR